MQNPEFKEKWEAMKALQAQLKEMQPAKKVRAPKEPKARKRKKAGRKKGAAADMDDDM